MRRPRGITLLEQMVAVALLVLTIGLAYQVLVPCLQVWQGNRAQAGLEQQARILQARLSTEMLQSTQLSLTSIADPPAVSFLAFDDQGSSYDASTGQPIWNRLVVYYVDVPNRVLYRKIWPNPLQPRQVPALPHQLPTLVPFQLSGSELQSVCTTVNQTETMAAGNVADLQMSQLPTGLPDLQLVLSTETRNGTRSLARQVAVQMRNSR